MAEHRQQRDDDGEGQAPPEAPPKIRELWILFVVDARHLGLERHSAYRAGSRAVAADFRMHRADVEGSRLIGLPR